MTNDWVFGCMENDWFEIKHIVKGLGMNIDFKHRDLWSCKEVLMNGGVWWCFYVSYSGCAWLN